METRWEEIKKNSCAAAPKRPVRRTSLASGYVSDKTKATVSSTATPEQPRSPLIVIAQSKRYFRDSCISVLSMGSIDENCSSEDEVDRWQNSLSKFETAPMQQSLEPLRPMRKVSMGHGPPPTTKTKRRRSRRTIWKRVPAAKLA